MTADGSCATETRWSTRRPLVIHQRIKKKKNSGIKGKALKSFLKPRAALFQRGGIKLAPSFSLGNNKWEIWKTNAKHTLALCTPDTT